MDIDFKLSHIIVPSALSAQNEIRKWSQYHDFSSILDAMEFPWQVRIKRWQTENELSSNLLSWSASIYLYAKPNVNDLKKYQVLNSVKDKRMIDFIQGYRVQMMMEALQLSEKSEQALEKSIIHHLPIIREKLNKSSLQHLKRKSIEEWIEKFTQFGQNELDLIIDSTR